MNWVDLCILAVVLVSTVAAMGRGIVVELLSLAGLVLGVVVAARYYSQLSVHLTMLHVPALQNMAAFLLIVMLCLLVMTWLGHILHRMAKYAGMGWLDGLLGAAFGLLRGVIAVTVAMMALAAFWPLNHLTQESRLAPYFMDAVTVTAKLTPPALHDKIDNGLWTIRQMANYKGWQ
jgi:membrane protein required for colicin V production